MKPRIPRNFFFYWSGQDFLYVHYLSIHSLLATNTVKRCEIYCRVEPIGNLYWEKLKQSHDIEIIPLDFDALFAQAGIKPDQCGLWRRPDLKENHLSDIFRYLILKCHGGIYIDFDMIIAKDFAPLLETEFFVGFQQAGGRVPLNGAVMGAAPEALALDLCLRGVCDYLKKAKTVSSIGCGPELLSRLLIRPLFLFLGKWGLAVSKRFSLRAMGPDTRFEVCPPSYFYPVPWHQWWRIFQPHPLPAETYALHLWGSKSHHHLRQVGPGYVRHDPSLLAVTLRRSLGADINLLSPGRTEHEVLV